MKKYSEKRVITWIGAIAGPEKYRLAALSTVRILQGVCGVVYAYCLKSVVDRATEGLRKGFETALILFALLIVLSLMLSAAGRHLQEKSRCRLERGFRVHAFSGLLSRDYAAVSAVHSGQWMNRITSDSQVIAGTASTLLPDVLGTVFRLLAALGTLAYMLPKAIVILLPCGLFMLLLSWTLRKKLKSIGSNLKIESIRLLGYHLEVLEA